jgi:hypothetical protein
MSMVCQKCYKNKELTYCKECYNILLVDYLNIQMKSSITEIFDYILDIKEDINFLRKKLESLENEHKDKHYQNTNRGVNIN